MGKQTDMLLVRKYQKEDDVNPAVFAGTNCPQKAEDADSLSVFKIEGKLPTTWEVTLVSGDGKVTTVKDPKSLEVKVVGITGLEYFLGALGFVRKTLRGVFNGNLLKLRAERSKVEMS